MAKSQVDLHIHTTFSDGTDIPEELVKKLPESGIKIFSVTDHDSTGDTDLIRKLADEHGMKYINGVEFSCHTVKLCHILGYNFDINNEEIIKLTERKLNIQKNKMLMRLDKIKELFNIAFSDEDTEWLFSNKRAGKPHIAQLLVKNGYAENIQDAFNRYIRKIKVKSPELSPEEAVTAIKNAGGIAIWAHPLGGEGESHFDKTNFTDEFNRVLSSGIDGIEVYYSRYNSDEIEYLLKLADENNLIVSGGSDYHGKNKDIELGQLNSEDVTITPDKLTILNKL